MAASLLRALLLLIHTTPTPNVFGTELPKSVEQSLRSYRPPSTASRNALVLAGELRTFVTPKLQARLLELVVRPLDADVYLAGSATWSRSWHWWLPPLPVLSRAEVDAALAAVRPVSAHLASDEAIVDALGRDGDCTTGSGGLRECPAQYALLLRWRLCLHLLRRGEAARGGMQYEFVVRARPDVIVGCTVDVPPAAMPFARARLDAHDAAWIVYANAWDYLALMNRRGAELSLGQLGLMGRSPNGSASARAFDARYLCLEADQLTSISEPCNPCFASELGGAHVYALRAPVEVLTVNRTRDLAKRFTRESCWLRPQSKPAAKKPLLAVSFVLSEERARWLCPTCQKGAYPLSRLCPLMADFFGRKHRGRGPVAIARGHGLKPTRI